MVRIVVSYVKWNITDFTIDFVTCLPSLLGVRVNTLHIQKTDVWLTASTLSARVEVGIYNALEGALVWAAESPEHARSALRLDSTLAPHLGASTSQQRQNNYPSLSSSSQNTQIPDLHGQQISGHDNSRYIN